MAIAIGRLKFVKKVNFLSNVTIIDHNHIFNEFSNNNQVRPTYSSKVV